jgi:hypothetical protein
MGTSHPVPSRRGRNGGRAPNHFADAGTSDLALERAVATEEEETHMR